MIRRLSIATQHLLQKCGNEHSIPLHCWTYRSLSTSQSYVHNAGKDPLVYYTVGQQLEISAGIFGSTEAIVSVHENKRTTFKDLLGYVDRVAAGYRKLGLRDGDCLGIWAPNYWFWYVSHLAAARAGLVSVGINPAYQASEIAYCLNKANIKALVAPETFKTINYYDVLCSICPEIANAEPGKIKSDKFPYLQSVIINNNNGNNRSLKGTLSFDQLLDLSGETEEIRKMQSNIIPESASNMQFTSGTTGHPKAAVVSHYSLVNNGIHIGRRNQLEGEKICVQVPLFHAYGISITIMAAMIAGGTLVLPAPGFSPKDSLQAIIKEQCTVLHGTPTMYVDLVRTQREVQAPLTPIKRAITGGASVSPQLIKDIRQVLGVQTMNSVYGLSESTAVIFQSQPGDAPDIVLNSVGYLQDHVEAKVIDDKGNTVPFGQPGELCVRGYCNMLGYHGDEAKTQEILKKDNWLHTGDQFILNENGYGRIVGRLKEMIIRGGENIYPKEIEDFLNAHPLIIESHVIGVPDERMGEEICAFVFLEKDADPKDLTNEALRQYFKGNLAHFKVPRYVIPVDSFPKTASGKIQKFLLLQRYSSIKTCASGNKH